MADAKKAEAKKAEAKVTAKETAPAAETAEAKEAAKTEETAAKESGSSNTDVYKQHLQKIVYQTLGVKVSKDKAWALFKNIIHGSVEHVLQVEGKKLPLSGVGTFEIIETSPRGSKAGLDKDGNKVEGAKVWDCVPRFRFYPSSTINARVEKEYGLGDHDDLEIKHYGLYADDEPEEKAAPAKKSAAKAEKAEKPAAKEEAKANSEGDGFEDLEEI